MPIEVGIKVIPYNRIMREARRTLKLTQRQLAEQIGVSTSLVSEIERMSHSVSETVATEIALVLGVDMDYLFPHELRGRPRETTSFDFVVQVESLQALSEETVDTIAAGPETAYMQTELHNVLMDQLHKLTPQQRRVVEVRFGLDGKDSMTLEEVARLFGLTRERVRQIEAMALARLRHVSSRRKLRPYIGRP